jgi:hypothetical protein
MTNSGAAQSTESTRRADIWIPRQDEYERLLASLDSERAITIVSGAAGVGKSTLLRSVAAAAADRGWTVVGPFQVTSATTVEFIVNLLRRAVGWTDPPTPLPTADVHPDELLGKDPKEITPAPSSRARLLAELARRSLLLVIDGYQASSEVEGWLLRFPAELAALNGHPAVVIAGGPGRIVDLGPDLEVVVELGPLTDHASRSFFADLGATLSPPANRREVEVLAKEAVADPRLIDPLVRTLEFTAGLPEAAEMNRG